MWRQPGWARRSSKNFQCKCEWHICDLGWAEDRSATLMLCIHIICIYYIYIIYICTYKVIFLQTAVLSPFQCLIAIPFHTVIWLVSNWLSERYPLRCVACLQVFWSFDHCCCCRQRRRRRQLRLVEECLSICREGIECSALLNGQLVIGLYVQVARPSLWCSYILSAGL